MASLSSTKTLPAAPHTRIGGLDDVFVTHFGSLSRPPPFEPPAGNLKGSLLQLFAIFSIFVRAFNFANCLFNPDGYVLSSDGESVRNPIAREDYMTLPTHY